MTTLFHVKRPTACFADGSSPTFHVKHGRLASAHHVAHSATMRSRRPDVEPPEQEFFLHDRN